MAPFSRFIAPGVRCAVFTGCPVPAGFLGFAVDFEADSKWDSQWDGLLVTFNKRMTKHVGWGASYTWSKGIDNGPNPSFVLIPQDSTLLRQGARPLRRSRRASLRGQCDLRRSDAHECPGQRLAIGNDRELCRRPTTSPNLPALTRTATSLETTTGLALKGATRSGETPTRASTCGCHGPSVERGFASAGDGGGFQSAEYSERELLQHGLRCLRFLSGGRSSLLSHGTSSTKRDRRTSSMARRAPSLTRARFSWH